MEWLLSSNEILHLNHLAQCLIFWFLLLFPPLWLLPLYYHYSELKPLTPSLQSFTLTLLHFWGTPLFPSFPLLIWTIRTMLSNILPSPVDFTCQCIKFLLVWPKGLYFLSNKEVIWSAIECAQIMIHTYVNILFEIWLCYSW